MSALPPKANIRRHQGDVRYVPKADIGTLTSAQELRRPVRGKIILISVNSPGCASIFIQAGG